MLSALKNNSIGRLGRKSKVAEKFHKLEILKSIDDIARPANAGR